MQERIPIPLDLRGATRDGATPPRSRAYVSAERSTGVMVKRVSLAAATAFLSINLWTGSPVLALWVGSQAADDRALSMTPLFVVVVTLLALTLAISAVLLWLEQRYRARSWDSPFAKRVSRGCARSTPSGNRSARSPRACSSGSWWPSCTWPS